MDEPQSIPLRLLILEDNPSDAELMLHQLRRGGFEADWQRVENEADYLTALDSSPDLILADYNLPQFDGLRALDLLAHSGLDIPFILVSGTIGEELAVEAMRRGASDYLLKDRMMRLGQATTRALEQKKLRDEKRSSDEALRASEERFRILFDSAAVGLGMADEQGNLLAYNSAMLKPGGYQPEDIARIRNVANLYYDPADRERVLALVREKGALRQHEVRFKRKDGTPYDALLHLIPLNLGGKRHLLAVVDDITERKQAEEKIRYQIALLANVNDAILAANKNLILTAWNRAAERIYGWKAEEAIGQTEDALLKSEYVTKDQSEVKDELDVTGEYIVELLQSRKDGLRISIEAHTSALRDPSGKITGYVSVNRDISERKQAEERFRLVIEAAPNAFILVNEQGNIVMVNTQAERFFGYERAELLDLNVENLVPERFRRNHIIHRARYYINQNTLLLGGGRDLYGVRKDGSEFPVEIGLTPIHTQDGMLVMATIVDITERKHAEEKLRASEERFRALIENSSDAVALLTAEGTILYESPAASRILGYSRNELVGSFAFDLIHPEDLENMAAEFSHLVQAETGILAKFRFRHKNGSWRWIEAVGTNMLKSLSIQAIVVNFRDITDRVEAELKIQQQLRRLTILRNIDETIAGSIEIQSVLWGVLSHLTLELKVDAAAILLYDADEQVLKFEQGVGFKSKALEYTRLRLGEGYAGKAALNRQTIHIPNLQARSTDFLRSPSFSEEGFISYLGVPLYAKDEINGVLELFQRSQLEPDQEWLDFLETLAGQAAIAIDNATLYLDLQETNIELVKAYDATIEGWSRALDLRDKETEGHTQRVAELTEKLARVMGVSEEEIIHIRRGALLHDIGKMGVPDQILLKPDKLTDEEWVIMRKHPQLAIDMLAPIDFMRPALDIPGYHHEKWDGSGYPLGLKGEQIPLAARLFAVVDVWDALRSDRPYRAAWSREKALEHIRSLAGSHFDPKVLEQFLRLVDQDGVAPG